jgi:hypothetical protein
MFSHYSLFAAYFAFWVVLFGVAVYLACKLHRKFYIRRSALRLLSDCYTPEQIQSTFRKTFATQMGPKVTAACNAFLQDLYDASIR